MGIVISPESELGRELARWEQHRTKYVGDEQQPGNPYAFRPYPRMVYQARSHPSGQTRCLTPMPQTFDYVTMDQYERALLHAESFNKSCQRIVQSEREYTQARDEGWRDTPAEALQHHEALERAIGDAAAEAAFSAQRMSSKAQRELQAADEATHEHVVDVKPARKRGRPAKGTPHAVTRSGELDA